MTKTPHSRLLPVPLLTPLLLLVLARASSGDAPDIALYEGKPVADSGLSVAAWGAGSGQESAETYLFGGHALKITTLDFYQGARISFATPVPLAGDDRILQITLRRGGATLHYDPRTLPGVAQGNNPNPLGSSGQYPGSGQYPDRRGRRGRGRGGNGQGRGMTPGGTAPGGTAAEAPLIPNITKLRLQFVLSDGRQADVLRVIPSVSDPAAGQGWYSVPVPISSLKFGGGAAPLLKSITLGGDQFGVFYVGRVRLASDAVPLSVQIDGPGKAETGQPLTFSAKGETGLSNVRYVWNFGDGESSEPDAGPTVTHAYTRGDRNETVTLTVTDVDGLKKPAQATKSIHINEGNPGGFPGGQGGFPGRFPGGQGGYRGDLPNGGQTGGQPNDGRNE